MTAEIAGVATTAPADSPGTGGDCARQARVGVHRRCAARPHMPLDADGRIVRINRVVERWDLCPLRTRSRATCTAFSTSAAPRRAASC